MNDFDDEKELTAEDRMLIEMVDQLARGEDPNAAVEAEAERLRLAGREWLETLGSMPHTLEPRAASPELRRRLLAAASSVPPAVAPIRKELAASRRSGVAPGARWLLPVAAALLIFAAAALWQQRQLTAERGRIAGLSAELAEVTARAEAIEESVFLLGSDPTLAALGTTPGAELSMLTPTDGGAGVGTLVLAPDRRSWFLRVEGLGPCASGGAYKVWFITEAGVVAGPSFRVRSADERVEVGAGAPPPRFSAVSITLEAGDEAAEPGGPRVLFGDKAMLRL